MTEDVPMGKWFCRGRGGDDVVRVGDGASAFWIDRYEATVWTGRDGLLPGMTGVTRFNSPGDFDAVAFPPNGQWRSGWTNTPPPMFALSVGGGRFTPARYITWFQAQEACRASGKRLPTGEEWLTAAQGTPDPGENNGRLPGNNRCHTIGDDVRTGTSGAGCRSAWGAEDMIGNVMEWTAEWYAGLTTVDVVSPSGSTPTDGWPVETNAYNGDGTWGIASSAYANQSGRRVGVPAAGVRGGQWGAGFRAGVFHVRLDYAPSMSNANLGFRCVIPR